MTIRVGVDFASHFVTVELPIPSSSAVVTMVIRNPIEIDYLIGQLTAAREAAWPKTMLPPVDASTIKQGEG